MEERRRTCRNRFGEGGFNPTITERRFHRRAMKQYTDITCLVDRSGSMNAIREGMEGAFRTFLEEHQKTPSTRLTLVQFDTIDPYEVVYEARLIGRADPLHLHPRGGTPLIDALCMTIDRTGERLARMRDTDRPDQVLMVIITDGQENASKYFKRQDVFDRVTKQHKEYKWEFVYLGANQDAFAEARSYGIAAGQTLTWTASPLYVGENSGFAQAFAGTTSNYVNTAGGMRGMSSATFTEEDRTKSATDADRKITFATTTVKQ